MAQERDTGRGLVIGGVGGTMLGALLATLLAAKPAEAAPPEEKLNFLIEALTALIQVLAEVADGQTTLINLMQQWLAAQGVAPGVEIAVLTPWKAKTPEQIYSNAIRAAGTFYSDMMVDWTKGKRFLLKIESSLNQTVTVQPIGNYVDDMNLATNINAPVDILANESHSIGLAWDDWHPFVGMRITNVLPAPTAGILNIWAVIQE